MNTDEKVKELIQPILDVMTGVDGGVAFCKLKFQHLPAFLEAERNGDSRCIEFLNALNLVSVMCKLLLKE